MVRACRSTVYTPAIPVFLRVRALARAVLGAVGGVRTSRLSRLADFRSAGTFWDVSAVSTPVRGVCPPCRWKFREGRTHCLGPSSGVASRLRCDGVVADSRVGAHGGHDLQAG